MDKKAITYQGIRAFLLTGLMFLFAATLVIGVVASLLRFIGIGLSLDACFLMATMIFCTIAVSCALVVGVASSHSEANSADEESLDEAELDDFKEEIANRVLANILDNLEPGHPLVRDQPAGVTQERHRRPAKSVASRKRK